jgi:predicted CXXCH cytochrome family protein
MGNMSHRVSPGFIRFGVLLGSLGLLGLFGILLNSCGTMPRHVLVPAEIPGARYVGNQACYQCHTNYVRLFPVSPHARMHFAPDTKVGPSGCEACHGPGSKHIAIGGGRGQFILNPGKDATACFNCHLETHAEFNLPQHHPVIEGRMNCVQCHDPHGADILKPAGGLAMARLNQSCAACHREQAKPFVFEHEALREGCTVCHSPHGSINAKLLIERDNNLCLKCHAQTQGSLVGAGQILIGGEDHTDKLKLGGCWSAGCHTAVHGSNFNPNQLY